MRTKRGVALLLIDVINGFDFEGSEGLVAAAIPAALCIEALARRARRLGVPVVYVNDNFGQWRSNFEATVQECTKRTQPGHAVVARLRPRRGDYFVLKPRHSGFFYTPLPLLLEHLGVDTLVLTGFATNLCVLFTANDAHMLGYHVRIPADCTASNTAGLTRAALAQVREALRADVRSSKEWDPLAIGPRRKKPTGHAL
ncbi:cysteine hydrolase [Pendulispora rubella]|uniref:Cysteine hydrolase n=1 Tax=Pendulispora rubella TaxID=2741070 RepID=A0ABZ2L1V5_9BACT